MVVITMSSGQKMVMTCPAHYANGGSELLSDYFGIKIAPDTPLVYELEILECMDNKT